MFPGEAWIAVAAAVTLAGVLATGRYGRLGRLESRLSRLDALNRRMGAFILAQQYHCIQHGYQPLPLPDDLYKELDSASS
ncbi:hypothetical protein [Mycetocola saprophilus]|uniref:hypothetical protein n=1 Tax=Mycetocola saprophilus TaxID=76636 RepID=UPI003BF00728